MKSIKTKLTIIFLLITLIPLASLSVLSYLQTTTIFTKTIQDFLLTIVKTKNDALVDYIGATETLGMFVAETDIVKEYIAFRNDGINSDKDAQLQALEKKVENLLYSVQESHWGKYHHIFLIDKSKKIKISPNHGKLVKGSPSSHLNEDTSSNTWAMETLSNGITTVSDYSSWVESDHSHQMLFFPIKDKAGITQAVIGFELQIPYENELLTKNVTLGETGRIFLTTTDGVPIVYKGIEEQAPLLTEGIIEVQKTGYSSDRRLNAEKIEVIDIYFNNKKFPWILVAEIEAKEAFSSLFAIQKTMLIGLIITFFVVLILSVLVANFIVNPIKRLTKQMEDVSLGKMETKVDITKGDMNRKDEIGRLVRAFHRISASLKIAMKNFDKDELK